MVDVAILNQLKSAYKTWGDTKGEGDAARNAWFALAADNVRIASMHDAAPGLAFAKPRKSRDEFIEYLTSLVKDWEMVHWNAETFVNEGDQVAMFGHCGWINRATRKPLETPVAHLWTFQGGKAIAVAELFDSARVAAAATA